MKTARMAIALLFTICLAALSACGGEDDGTADLPGGVGSESQLREAAQQYADAFFAGDYLKAYSFFAPEWQQRCPFEDFAGIGFLVETLIGELKDAELVIDSVRIEDFRGDVEVHVEIGGREVNLWDEDEEEEYPSYWVWQDGKWWATDDDPAPCEMD